MTNKRISIYLLLFLLIVITAGFLKKNKNSIPAVTAAPDIIQKTVTNKIKKTEFKSNDEIKKEYGRLETVILWNGRKYTGAVISTNPVYSIVTVQGLVNIQMKDVKIREIIR